MRHLAMVSLLRKFLRFFFGTSLACLIGQNSDETFNFFGCFFKAYDSPTIGVVLFPTLALLVYFSMTLFVSFATQTCVLVAVTIWASTSNFKIFDTLDPNPDDLLIVLRKGKKYCFKYPIS